MGGRDRLKRREVADAEVMIGGAMSVVDGMGRSDSWGSSRSNLFF
jgi:hypothetical protein